MNTIQPGMSIDSTEEILVARWEYFKTFLPDLKNQEVS